MSDVKAKKNPVSPADSAASQQTTALIEDLQQQLVQAREAHLRSQADYQNLQRRTQEDRVRFTKLATRELITDLVQPLDHLSLAAAELKDPGLDMTIKQFWQMLENHGLQEIEVMGKPFDVHLMEVVERQGEGETVIGVVNRGYTLNGEVIQHAKVIVGQPGKTSATDSPKSN